MQYATYSTLHHDAPSLPEFAGACRKRFEAECSCGTYTRECLLVSILFTKRQTQRRKRGFRDACRLSRQRTRMRTHALLLSRTPSMQICLPLVLSDSDSLARYLCTGGALGERARWHTPMLERRWRGVRMQGCTCTRWPVGGRLSMQLVAALTVSFSLARMHSCWARAHSNAHAGRPCLAIAHTHAHK